MTPSTTMTKEFEEKIKSIPWHELAGQQKEFFIDTVIGSNETGDGSIDNPVRTLGRAMELVASGDQLRLHSHITFR